MTSRNFSRALSCGLSGFAMMLALASCAPASHDQAAAPKAAAPEAVAFTPDAPVTRRLTAEQYQNIIADVFGRTIELGGRFEPELRVGGLLAVGTSNVSITAAGMEQYDAMARHIAAQVVDEKRRDVMLPCKPIDAKAPDDKCTAQFMAQTGRLLYRRPLTQTELVAYVHAANLATTMTKDFYNGLAMSLAGMLSSPKFLFRKQELEPDPAHKGAMRLNAYAKASQLSFFLWNSAPDLPLLDAAQKGELNTQKGLAKQAERMMASPRVEAGVRAFFTDNFGFDEFETLTKDTALFPKFSAQAAEDAQEQTLKTIVDLVVTNNGDYRDIFTTKKTFLTQELAAIYKVPIAIDVPNGSPEKWEPYQFRDNDPRAGILTQVAFTGLHSPPGRSSATIRGKAVREVLLCQKVPAPPGNVNFNLVQDTNNPNYKTARQRLTAHATEAMCTGCHKIIDPIGLALENFDGEGAYRLKENGAEIDVKGSLDGVAFNGAADLGRAIHDSPSTPNCLVDRLSAYAVGRAVKSDSPWVQSLKKSFAASGYRMPALMHEIALSDAFYVVAAPETKSAETASPQTTAARLEGGRDE